MKSDSLETCTCGNLYAMQSWISPYHTQG